MVGGGGIDSTSSAQLRQAGTGVEHSSAGLESGGTKGRAWGCSDSSGDASHRS
jgi:hypothetical protein